MGGSGGCSAQAIIVRTDACRPGLTPQCLRPHRPPPLPPDRRPLNCVRGPAAGPGRMTRCGRTCTAGAGRRTCSGMTYTSGLSHPGPQLGADHRLWRKGRARRAPLGRQSAGVAVRNRQNALVSFTCHNGEAGELLQTTHPGKKGGRGVAWPTRTGCVTHL